MRLLSQLNPLRWFDQKPKENDALPQTPALRQPEAPAAKVGATTVRHVPFQPKGLAHNPAVIETFARAKGAHGEELPGFDQWLTRQHGVPATDGPEARVRLLEVLNQERDQIKAALGTELSKSDKKAVKRYDQIFKAAIQCLERASPDNLATTATAVRTAKELIYTAIAKDVRDVAGGRMKVGGALGVARRFVAQETYYLAHADAGARLEKGPEAEATNLVHPKDPTRFITVDELRNMNVGQVADLDIAPNHPMWRTEAERQALPDPYGALEAWLNKAVTAELQEKFPGVNYNFHQASRVVFFDSLRDAATSPKIGIVDAYGQELGLKWGEECAVEPALNRLLVKLGLKFTDITVNNVGRSSPMLILASPEEKAKAKPGEVVPTNASEFVTAMMASAYKFNAKPHLQSAERITEANVDRIIAALPEGTAALYPREKLLGRTVLTFKESMVEAKHEVLGRAGPVALHSEAAKSDRVHRGMQLAYMWLRLPDNKEDNHRYSLPKGFEGKGHSAFSFIHDTGSGMGSAGRSGQLNDLNTDWRFLSRSAFGLGGALRSTEFQLYRAGAWEQETASDVLWMAKKIVTISQKDLADCANATGWPDFMKATMVYRLAKRRDMIAEAFGLKTADPVGAAPTFKVPLSTPADREAAATRYEIDVTLIEESMRDSGVLGRPFEDLLVDRGTISDPKDTVLIGILQDTYFPVGLVKRTNRREDGREYVSARHEG
ncbi:MAG: hypothetical protein IPG45_29995 [Deltaproteobacteria bacterium]|nr:hypothetical protein [Deltaproteobacteria bacterium]